MNIKEVVTSPVGTRREYDIEIDIDALPISGKLTLTKVDDAMLAEFDVHLEADLECSRCLDEFKDEMNLRFKTEYGLDEAEDEPGAGKFFVHNFEIDMLEPIRQELLVNMPIRKLCKVACKGLCPNCGINWNTAECGCDIDRIS